MRDSHYKECDEQIDSDECICEKIEDREDKAYLDILESEATGN